MTDPVVERRAQRACRDLSTPDALVTTLRAAGVVFAEEEAGLLLEAATDDADLETRVARRCAGEPLELVVGWAAFDGLRIPVAPGVFVARRRSEALVEVADRILATRRRPPVGDLPVVVDLCCGSGALGAAVATRVLRRAGRPPRLVLTDDDPAASSCARTTLAAVGLPGDVATGDLFDPLPADLRGAVDVLLANVPYVPTAEVALLPREARDHEPRTALDGGPDGLALLRRVAVGAGDWLADDGTLLCEVTSSQVPAALAALTSAGLHGEAVADASRDTVVVRGSVPARCDR